MKEPQKEMLHGEELARSLPNATARALETGLNNADLNKFVSQSRVQATNLLTTIHNLRALKEKMTALDLLTVADDSVIAGDNAGIEMADVSAVLSNTLGAIDTLFAQGHASNLHKLALL